MKTSLSFVIPALFFTSTFSAWSTLVTISGTNWSNGGTWEDYFQAGETWSTNGSYLTNASNPFPQSRNLASAANSVSAAGFFQDPDADFLTYGNGIYAVEIAPFSGSSTNAGNFGTASLGLYSTNATPSSTIGISTSNSSLVLGAEVSNQQRNGFDTLRVVYRDINGDPQQTQIALAQGDSPSGSGVPLDFPAYSARTSMVPYTLRLDVTGGNSLRVRLLSGGLNGSVIETFDTGVITIEGNPFGHLGWGGAATTVTGQSASNTFNNFHVNAAAIPEPASAALLLLGAGGMALLLRRRKACLQKGWA